MVVTAYMGRDGMTVIDRFRVNFFSIIFSGNCKNMYAAKSYLGKPKAKCFPASKWNFFNRNNGNKRKMYIDRDAYETIHLDEPSEETKLFHAAAEQLKTVGGGKDYFLS